MTTPAFAPISPSFSIIMCRCGGGSEHQHLEVTFQTDLYSNISFVETEKTKGNVQHVVREYYKQVPENFDPLQPEVMGSSFLICLYMKEPTRVASIVLEAENVKSINVFVNPKVPNPDDHLTFEDISALRPTQQFLLSTTSPDVLIEYQTRVALYDKVKILVLYFHSHHAPVLLKFLAFTGHLSMQQSKAVRATYELRPQLADHPNSNSLYSSSMNRELQ